MKPRIPLFAITAFLLLPLAPSLTFAAAPGHDHSEEEHTELGNHMEEIARSWRQVRRSSRDSANNAANAERVAGMLKHAKAGIDLIPVHVEDIPESEREAFLADYRKEMKVFVDLLSKLREAFASDDHAAAVELVATISKHQRSSHKKFQRPDEDQ